jgi:NAD kinase
VRKADQKIVLVTRETRLAGLRKRFATKSQAKFYVARALEADKTREALAAGAPVLHEELRAAAEEEFHEYEEEQQFYDESLTRLRADLEELGPPVQIVERAFLPHLVFGPNDIVVTVGQDGLVANVAKYALRLPIVAVNPDPKRIDGVLLPFGVDRARAAVRRVLDGTARTRSVTMAQAILPAGQRILAFNDLFIGAQSHVSARYRIRYAGRSEPQSSSGVIVSTGAGSTGWLSSIFNMNAGLCRLSRSAGTPPVRMKWEDPRLMFVVREPFVSKNSGASVVAGMIEPAAELIVESLMATGGVIFSDGVESDFLAFNSGTVARIRAASEQARLVIAS